VGLRHDSSACAGSWITGHQPVGGGKRREVSGEDRSVPRDGGTAVGQEGERRGPHR